MLLLIPLIHINVNKNKLNFLKISEDDANKNVSRCKINMYEINFYY